MEYTRKQPRENAINFDQTVIVLNSYCTQWLRSDLIVFVKPFSIIQQDLKLPQGIFFFVHFIGIM